MSIWRGIGRNRGRGGIERQNLWNAWYDAAIVMPGRITDQSFVIRMRSLDVASFRQVFILIALVALEQDIASVQLPGPRRQQVQPHLVVEFRLAITPDKDAQTLGAVPFSNVVSMNGGIWADEFTGSGCVVGRFYQSAIDLKTGDDVYPFKVSCKGVEQAASFIEWNGVLRGGKIHGDVWITLAGTPLTAQQIADKKQRARDEAKRETVFDANGAVTNAKEIDQEIRAIDHMNLLLPAQGRRLHFTFDTAEVVITPTGPWSERERAAATRPSEK